MDKIRKFLTSDWAINRQDLSGILSVITPCIVSGRTEDAENLLEKNAPTAKAVAAPYVVDEYELDSPNLPDNSIATIYLRGTLYAWDTDCLLRLIDEVEKNPAIVGLVLIVDGLGGHADRVDVAAAKIKEMTKPSATLVTGSMCSAHYWLGSSTDRVFALSPLCTVGSVGAMCTFTSLSEFFKSNGIEILDIYPTSSDLKNEEYRALESGDDELTKSRLERLHKVFAEAVAENRAIPYDPKLDFYRGRVFFAEDAVKLGYIDCIGEFSDAVLWVLTQATGRQAAQLYQ